MNRAFHRSAGPAQGASCAATELARWQCYMEALDCAGQAMDRARKLVPDHGPDHGVERIRALLIAAVAELERLQGQLDTERIQQSLRPMIAAWIRSEHLYSPRRLRYSD